MKRAYAILIFLLLFTSVAEARKDEVQRFTFGAEWGYVAEIWSGFHNNFFAPEGYRVNQRESSFGYKGNTDTYIHVGYNLDEKWNLAMYIGYAGIDKEDKILPVTLRGTRFYGPDPMADRFFTFLDLGSGICLKKPVQEIFTGRFGGGYRMSLSPDTKLDLMVGLSLTYTHPEVIHDGRQIPHKMINRNDKLCGGLSISLALTI